MIEEREDDRPEWEIPEEKIPPSLQKKWDKEEGEGLKGGVCKSCGYPFTGDDLTCLHCGELAEIPKGVFTNLRDWCFKTPMGILIIIITILTVLLSLIY